MIGNVSNNYPNKITLNSWKKSKPIYPASLAVGIMVLIAYFSILLINTQYDSELVQVNKDMITTDTYSYSSTIDYQGNIFVAWLNEIDDSQNIYEILVSRSTDGGKSFSNGVRINDVNGTPRDIGDMSLETSENGDLYVVWSDERTQKYIADIYFDVSKDSGLTFGDDILINDDHSTTIIEPPSIQIDNNKEIHVVWYDQRNSGGVYYSKFDKFNNNFSKNICVNDKPEENQQYGASFIVGDNGNINIVWVENSGSENIFFTKSTDGGNSFSRDKQIGSNGLDPDFPKIAVNKNNLYVVWQDEDEDNNRIIYLSRSTNNGESWSTPTSLDRSSSHLGFPSITTTNNGDIYVAWAENTEMGSDIKIAKSTNNGVDWAIGTPQNIDAEYISEVSIISHKNDIYLTWVEGGEGKWDIFISKVDPEQIQTTTDFILFSILIPSSIITLTTLIFITATEFGRYAFIKFLGAPFYSKIKNIDLLQHELRKKLYSHINSNPGDHFKSIQKNFKIGSGTLAYHISVLERGEYIKSKRYGLYKRFYPKDFQIDNIEYLPRYPLDSSVPNYSFADTYNQETDVQAHILDVIRRNPGITQKDLAQLVGLSLTGLNYHINIMANARVIKVIRDGKWTRCYIFDEN